MLQDYISCCGKLIVLEIDDHTKIPFRSSNCKGNNTFYMYGMEV